MAGLYYIQEMIPVFYTDPENITDDTLTICGGEANHLIKVMRMKKGDVIEVVNGSGAMYRCVIEAVQKGIAVCKIYQSALAFGEPWHFVTLAAGLSTGIKFDEVIERCTELGVSRFIPLVTEKSKVKVDTEIGQKRKLDRWRKVAIASIKQTRRSLMPSISPMVDFKSLFEKYNDLGKILLFNPEADFSNLDKLTPCNDDRNYTIIVGPESGFSHEEIAMGLDKGAMIISLGRRILRTENAAPTAIALLMHILGEFS